jgi:hypothetical protein
MLRPHFWDAERLQPGRKLRTLTFRDKHALRQQCIEVCHETSDEHGNPEQTDAASADTFGAVVRVAGLAMHAPLSPSAFIDMHGDRIRLWGTAETAVRCAHHNPFLINHATRLSKMHCAGKACLIGSQYPAALFSAAFADSSALAPASCCRSDLP